LKNSQLVEARETKNQIIGIKYESHNGHITEIQRNN